MLCAMTATFNLSRSDVFPVGTEVSAYPLPSLPSRPLPGASMAPVATADDTDTVDADGILHFTGLDEGARYEAAAEISGSWRRVFFRTSKGSVVQAVGSTVNSSDAADAALWPSWRTRRRQAGLV